MTEEYFDERIPMIEGNLELKQFAIEALAKGLRKAANEQNHEKWNEINEKRDVELKKINVLHKELLRLKEEQKAQQVLTGITGKGVNTHEVEDFSNINRIGKYPGKD